MNEREKIRWLSGDIAAGQDPRDQELSPLRTDILKIDTPEQGVRLFTVQPFLDRIPLHEDRFTNRMHDRLASELLRSKREHVDGAVIDLRHQRATLSSHLRSALLNASHWDGQVRTAAFCNVTQGEQYEQFLGVMKILRVSTQLCLVGEALPVSGSQEEIDTLADQNLQNAIDWVRARIHDQAGSC